jgi:hypothetical protein
VVVEVEEDNNKLVVVVEDNTLVVVEGRGSESLDTLQGQRLGEVDKHMWAVDLIDQCYL